MNSRDGRWKSTWSEGGSNEIVRPQLETFASSLRDEFLKREMQSVAAFRAELQPLRQSSCFCVATATEHSANNTAPIASPSQGISNQL